MTAEIQFLNDDTDARIAAMDVERSYIVQAPAGSGKTELLIQRYLKLLATVDNPEEVLAITFTRKAAAEMHFRVLQALKSSARGDTASEAHQIVTAEAASAVLKKDKELQWQLIASPGRMRIQTLDSLNASISRMQPMSSGSGAAHNAIVADAEMSALYRNAAFLTLDQLAENGALRDATEKVLLHVDNNTNLYASYVARMLATRDQWLPFVGSGLLDADEATRLRARFESNLEVTVLKSLSQIHVSMPTATAARAVESAQYAAEQLAAVDRFDSPIHDLHGLSAWSSDSVADISYWQGLAELLLTKQGQWRKTVTKAQGFPTGDSGQKKTFLELLADLQDESQFRALLHGARDLPPTSYSDTQWSVLLALFRLLPLAVTELKRLFGERGITDYIEVALSAADALGTADDPGDVALLLDYQLRHLLVDEMQDTASAQYRMLEALTGGWQQGDGRTMFCVGDPMQSIYRFRNAEVGQFLLAKKVGIGSVPLDTLTLRRNFRSGQKLVDWFNAVFPDVLAKRDDAAHSAVSYAEAVSVPKLAGQGAYIVHPVFGSDSDVEAELGCATIRATLAAHPDDDMAVLVRGRAHLSVLLANLRQADIPYRAVEIDRLTDLPEIIDVLALTRAIVHRGDRLAWLAVLRSPWAGLDWTDLHSLVTGTSSSSTIWDLLNDSARLEKLSGFGRDTAIRIRELLRAEMRANRIESLRDRIERVWLALGGPAILQDVSTVENVYRYLDVLEQLEDGGTLSDVAELESALDLEHVSSDSSARLQIMTMHRAKGLQFDHVLLFGLGRAPGQHEKSVLSWFDIPGGHGIDEKILSPIGPRSDVDNDPLHRFIEKVEASKFQHELGRLLYVACTRARQSLHLMGHVELSSDATEVKTPRAGSLLRLLWHAIADDYHRAFDPELHRIPERDRSPWLLPQLRRFESAWVVPEFLALPKVELPAEPDEAIAEVEFYWVGSEARTAGTLVHRWLQLAADGRVSLRADAMPDIGLATQRWLQRMGIAGEPAESIGDRVLRALNATTDDEKGRWIIDGPGEAELALTGVYDGEVSSVILDRIRIDEQGVHWIIDYKTSTHEGGNLQSFLDAEITRYTPQLQKYRQLYADYSKADVRCALYFPMLQEFVPVPL
jgi:ATP-dependent helicase/nuclease subunit A